MSYMKSLFRETYSVELLQWHTDISQEKSRLITSEKQTNDGGWHAALISLVGRHKLHRQLSLLKMDAWKRKRVKSLIPAGCQSGCRERIWSYTERPGEHFLIVPSERQHPSSELKCLVSWPAPETEERSAWRERVVDLGLWRWCEVNTGMFFLHWWEENVQMLTLSDTRGLLSPIC